MNPLIVVTGGTKGIGRATIENFAARGFDVATCARSEADLQKLKADIEQKYPAVRVFVQPCDFAQKADVLTFGRFITALNRPVDVLINNAGIFAAGAIDSEPDGLLESLMAVNLYSVYHLTRALMPGMVAERGGHIFNLCSIASVVAYPNGGSYCMSKFALYGFTKVLREELKPHGVRVTAVLPGATLTPSWDGVELPADRFIKASDVADSIAAGYLLSKNTVIEELILRPQLGDI